MITVEDNTQAWSLSRQNNELDLYLPRYLSLHSYYWLDFYLSLRVDTSALQVRLPLPKTLKKTGWVAGWPVSYFISPVFVLLNQPVYSLFVFFSNLLYSTNMYLCILHWFQEGHAFSRFISSKQNCFQDWFFPNFSIIRYEILLVSRI